MKLGFSVKWDTTYLARHPFIIPLLISFISIGALIVSWKITQSGSTSAHSAMYGIAGFLIGALLSHILLFFTIRANKSCPQIEKEVETLQAQLIEKDRLASIGLISAGIAHEIKNPLNFINNFSKINLELLDELKSDLNQITETDSVNQIIADLSLNETKIQAHAQRTENIVKNMLLQSRKKELGKEPTDVNLLIEEYANLAYHGLRAQDSNFNLTFKKSFDPNLGLINASPQSIGQVLLNLINNACYAAYDKKKLLNNENTANSFMPTLSLTTTKDEAKNQILISIKDNGNGISESIRQHLFTPFYTTKPTGVGTGLGLFISHDIIVKQHNGELKAVSIPGEYTEFIIILPIK